MIGKIVTIKIYDHSHDFYVGDKCEVIAPSEFADNIWVLKRLKDGYTQLVNENQFEIEK